MHQGQSESIIFLLPAYGGTGGSNSVVYDAIEYNRFGVKTRIAAPDYVYTSLRRAYGSLYNFESLFAFYNSVSDRSLSDLLSEGSHVVGTIWTTISTIDKIVSRPDTKLLYFVQDYEPLFYQENTDEFRDAAKTYNNDRFKMYAKSQRIIDLVEAHHSRPVHKVLPSIRTDIFYPDLGARRAEPRIGIMLRPSTPYRNSEGNLRVLSAARKKVDFSVVTFGADRGKSEELCSSAGIDAKHYGFLTPAEVGSFFRSCDIFMDLSFHQGFGRLGLEAAACGCACILPAVSGLGEILREDMDCFYARAEDEEGAANLIEKLVDDQRFRRTMQIAAATSAGVCSSHSAALSSLEFILQQPEI